MEDIIATKFNDQKYLLLEMNNATNSFTQPLLRTLEHWLDVANDDKQIHSIVITSLSKVFSVGGDLKEMKKEIEGGNPSGYVDKVVPIINRVIKKVVTHNVPIITIINGSAAGGGLMLALASDHLVAKSKINLAPAFGTLALTPDSGASVLVQNHFGHSAALRTIAAGDRLTSDDAFKLGSIEFIGNDTELTQYVAELTKKYANCDRWTLGRTKWLLNQGIIEKLDKILDLELSTIHDASHRDTFNSRLDAILSRMK